MGWFFLGGAFSRLGFSGDNGLSLEKRSWLQWFECFNVIRSLFICDLGSTGRAISHQKKKEREKRGLA